MLVKHTPIIVFSLIVSPKIIAFFQITEFDNIDNNYCENVQFIGS